MAHNNRVSNPRFQIGRGGDSPNKKPTCTKYGKKHMVNVLLGQIIVLVVERVAIRSEISLW